MLSYTEGRLYVPDRYGIYGYHGFSRVALPWLRTWANMLLPFDQPLGLRSLGFARLALLGVIVLMVGAVRRWLHVGSALVVCVVAVSILILPTSMFAGVNNGDQYLYLPSFAVAGFMGCVAGEMLRRGSMPRLAAIAAMGLYALFGALSLHRSAQLWMQAADRVQTILMSVRTVAPPNQITNLTLLNIPHSNSVAPILANGVLGALIAIGYQRDLQLSINYGGPSYEQQLIVRQLLECRGHPAASSSRAVLIPPETAVELDPACASPTIAADRLKRPLDWASF